jgi:hypothetical protein
LNPFDVFLWEHQDNLMYSSAVVIAEELLQHFQNGCTSVHNTCGIFQLVHQSMHSWAEAFVAVQDQDFDYCNPNSSCYALSVECRTTFTQLLHSFLNRALLLLIMFA